ncbi:MAG: glycosyltransferase family 2 protein [Planctomycetota bacterium]|nr:glycosyltransferase family 2 protein [Planctomycetota bacterium]
MSANSPQFLRPRVAVVIPALDEERALPHVLAAIPPALHDVVVVGDNGSRDRTAEVARAAGAIVVHEPRRGYGSACLAALDVVLGKRPPPGTGARGAALLPLRDPDIVVFLDADLSDHPEDLCAILAPLCDGTAEFVVGSRTRDEASRAALTPQQRFGNALACFLLRVLFGARHTDLGPFRAIRVDALRHLAMRDRDYGWTVEMQLKARVARLEVVEVPVRYRARVAGESKVSGTWVGSVRAGWKILGWILGWRLRLLTGGARIPRFPRPSTSGTK